MKRKPQRFLMMKTWTMVTISNFSPSLLLLLLIIIIIIIHPSFTSPPLNVENHAITLVHLSVVAARTKSGQPHPHTPGFLDPTPFLPTYTPDLTIIHTHIEPLRTFAPLNPSPWCQIYWLNPLPTYNLDAHLISALNENIPQFLLHPAKM
jgi:hypothetical protein